MSDDRKAEIRAALRAEDVANHLGIKGQWRGRWMRSRRCAKADHSSEAFGLARDGMWHCWACDEGGDLLKLIAIGEGLDVRNDFPKVLELAALLAGLDVEDDFGGVDKPAPKERPEPPPVEPIADRLALARKRAAWAWTRMMDVHTAGERGLVATKYLAAERGIPSTVCAREDIRDSGMRIESRLDTSKIPELERLIKLFAYPGVAIPVRSPKDGALVDIRVRRFEPRKFPDGTDQPKIVGMLGGVTSAPASDGRGRELLGCYGFPHDIRNPTVIVVEGLIDYLTALCAWPDADVLGAVEAGSLSLVALHAANEVARQGSDGRVLIVEHADGFGKAGDRAVNEEPNAATKVAIRVLGPRRVGWVFCGGKGPDGKDLKDLNDLWRAGVRIDPKWWSEVGDGEAA